MRLTYEKCLIKYNAFMIRCNFSDKTIDRKMVTLNLFNNWLLKNHSERSQDYRGVTPEHILDYMDSLYLKRIQPSTIKSYMGILKTFFKFLYNHDFIIHDPTRKMPTVKVPKKDVDFISHDVIVKTLDNMLDNPVVKGQHYDSTVRDYLIIRVAYVTGWRSSDALRCDPANIDWDTGIIYLPKRKGGKDGYAYMDMETTKMLKQWYYSKYPNGKRLWYSMGPHSRGKPIGPGGYYDVFFKYFKKGSHRMRASCATYLALQGTDIKDIADILGHESIVSTQKYVAVVRSKTHKVHQNKNPFAKK